MVADTRPVSYTYSDTRVVLSHLGFTEEKPTGTSHRKWWRLVKDASSSSGMRKVVIALKDDGGRPLKPGWIRDMVRGLRENNLLPPGYE